MEKVNEMQVSGEKITLTLEDQEGHHRVQPMGVAV